MKISRKYRPELNRQLFGLSALNSFSLHNSSSRSVMLMNQLSQVLALRYAEPRLVLSGLETEMAKANSHHKIEDAIVLDILEYYEDSHVNTNTPDMVDVIYFDKGREVVDLLRIKTFAKYDKKFGFEHEFRDELANLRPMDDITSEVKLTRTNSEVSDGEYGFGVNLAVMAITDDSVAEDAIVISTTAAEKLQYYTYETIRFDFGGNYVPLNIHGDDNTYKCIPDVGDEIGEDGVIAATRKIDDDVIPALFSFKALQDFSPTFDKVFSAQHAHGTVVEVNVIHTPKNAKYTMYDGTFDQLDGYAKAQAHHRNRLIERANYWINQYRTVAGDELHPILINAMRISSDKTNNLYKQDAMAEYTVDITIRYTNIPTLKHKITTMHGGKGIISGVLPPEQMPLDKNGIRAEMLMNPNSTFHRMNLGGKFEGYITTATYMLNMKIKEMFASKRSTDEIYSYVLGFVKFFGNEQYDVLSSLTDQQKGLFVKQITRDRFQVFLPIDNVVKTIDIVGQIRDSIYAPDQSGFSIYKDGAMVDAESDGMCEIMYIFLLNKTGETGLSVASAKLNHFGLPTAPNMEMKKRMCYNGAPTKILSETETRLIVSTAGVEALAELRNRNLNHDSHYNAYDSILRSERPTDISSIIDRNVRPITRDVPSDIFMAIMNSMGLTFNAK